MLLRVLLVAAGLGIAAPAIAQDYAREVAAAAALEEICRADKGQLWGVDLCGPLIVVDPVTRGAWASRADGNGVLQQNGDFWTGTLPQGVAVANTSVEWAGVRWIMITRPLPADATELRILVAHEAWHRVQAGIGLAALGSDCAHLDTERGRYLLRLELRALRRAVGARGEARWRAARDALAFRAARFGEFSRAAAQEAALDRNEGLAAYTGVKLGDSDHALDRAARILGDSDARESYTRSYAYASGPAYGLLLDGRRPRWRTELGGGAPADLLAQALGATYSASALARTAALYGGAAIAAEEQARAESHRVRIAQLRARFAEGPRLLLPLKAMKMEFDPNRVTPVEGLGGFYGMLILRDAWGELRATDGALISSDFTQAVAASPDAGGLTGPGWTLKLNSDYRISQRDAMGIVRVESGPPVP